MSAKAEKVGIVNMDAIKDAIAILESDGDEHGVAAKLRAALAQNAQGEAVGEYVANIDKHGGVIWRAGPPPHGSKLYTNAEHARVPQEWRSLLANLAAVVRVQNGNRHDDTNRLLDHADRLLAVTPQPDTTGATP